MPVNRAFLFSKMGNSVDVNDRFVVDPFFPESVRGTSGASLDFHLGCRFAFFRRRRGSQHSPFSDGGNEGLPSEVFVPLGKEVYLHPGQLVLGTTLEWFRFPKDFMAYVVGRSIWGRRGVLIATALAVQPLSSGRITLELSNVGEVTVVLQPGVAVGQLFFHRVEGAEEQMSTQVSSFAGAFRPTLGEYKPSLVEELLLNIEVEGDKGESGDHV